MRLWGVTTTYFTGTLDLEVTGTSAQVLLFGRVLTIDTRAQCKLLNSWIILVIVTQQLVIIDRIDGPAEYSRQTFTGIKTDSPASHQTHQCCRRPVRNLPSRPCKHPNSHPWSPFTPRRAIPGSGPHSPTPPESEPRGTTVDC